MIDLPIGHHRRTTKKQLRELAKSRPQSPRDRAVKAQSLSTRVSRAKYTASGEAERSPSPLRTVVVGDVTDLTKVPNLILSYGIVRINSGTFVSNKDPDKFRTLGKAGPASSDHPLTRLVEDGGAESLISAEKVRRDGRLQVINQNRAASSQKQTVLELLETNKHLKSHAAVAVAEIVGLTPDQVRRIRKKNKPA